MGSKFPDHVGDLIRRHDYFARWELVLWDLDGTLFDEGEFLRHAYGRIAEFVSGAHGSDRQQAHDFLMREFDDGGRGGLFDRFCVAFDIPKSSIPDFLAIMRVSGMEMPLSLYPEADFLMRLFGALSLRQGIVTNGNPAQQLNKIERTGILARHRISEVVFCDRVGRKPAPSGLLRAMDRLNVKPDRTIFFGDTDTDATAAERAGVQFIRVDAGRLFG